MRKIRTLLYINSDFDSNRITCHGIEFNDFISFLKEAPRNILLLKHNFYGAKYNSKTKLEYVDSDNMSDLINDNVYAYGTFCWIDFADVEALNEITSSKLSKLLYFGHVGVPVKNYRILALKNRFAYWSHDDGWYNQIYCRNYKDFSAVIDRSIILRIIAKRRTINSIGEELSLSLLNLSQKGLLIDFNELSKDGRDFELPVYIIGKLDDMDAMCNNISKYKREASKRFILDYKRNKWDFKEVTDYTIESSRVNPQ